MCLFKRCHFSPTASAGALLLVVGTNSLFLGSGEIMKKVTIALGIYPFVARKRRHLSGDEGWIRLVTVIENIFFLVIDPGLQS